MKIKGVTLIGLIIMILALIMEAGLFAYTFTDKESEQPCLVLYGLDDGRFPDTSFRMAMKSAGFEFVVLTKDLKKANDIGEEISLPQGYRSKKIVVLAKGNDATSAMKLFDDDEDTMGFVLVDPTFETNFSMEGMSTEFPVHHVAIFTGDRSEKSDAKLIYERLSSEDTMFGVKFKTGGVFSSETYMNPEGNRFLSVAGIEYGEGDAMWFSPFFQIELANYLAADYDTAADVAFRIAAWYALVFFFAIFFLTGLFLFLSKMPIMRYKMDLSKKSKLDTVGFAFTAAVAVISTILFVLCALITRFNGQLKYIAAFDPIVFVILLAFVRIMYVMSNRKVKRQGNISQATAVILTILMSASVLLFLLNFFGNGINGEDEIYIPVACLGAILDFAAVMLLAVADNISRAKGLGGCSYYGKQHVIVFMLIPSVMTLLITAGIGKNIAAFECFVGAICVGVPFLASIPVKRHTNSSVFTALTHSLTLLCVLLLTA